MHPHNRRITNKQFAQFSPPSDSAAHSATPVTAGADLEVNDEVLPHLAKDLANIRAERYREVDSEDARDDDIRQAEAEIAAMFKRDDSA